MGILYTAASAGPGLAVSQIVADCVWRVFNFGILSMIGSILTELKAIKPIIISYQKVHSSGCFLGSLALASGRGLCENNGEDA